MQAPGCPKLRQGAAYILLRVREHASRGWNNKLKPEQGVGVCTRSGCTLVCEHAPYSRGWNNKHQAAQQTRPRPQPEAGAQHPDTRLRFRSTREQPAHGCLRTGVPKGRGSQRTAAQNTRTSLFGVRTRLGQPVRELARDRFVGRGLAYWCTAPGGWSLRDHPQHPLESVGLRPTFGSSACNHLKPPIGSRGPRAKRAPVLALSQLVCKHQGRALSLYDRVTLWPGHALVIKCRFAPP